MRIMVVEDEVLIRMELTHRLIGLGHKVVAATGTGEEAVELAGNTLPELILMDIKLKGQMNGLEAAQMILRRVECRIVFISAFENSLIEADEEFLRQVSFLPKPLSDRALAAILDVQG